jgi:phosphoribosylaminoimidazole-succinocarboxamide synthase
MLIKEGESKIVRYIGCGIVDIELKPTVYSFTHNRTGIVEGSDKIRLECCNILCELLRENQIRHSYLTYENGHIQSYLVYEPDVFSPPDLAEPEIKSLPKFCPIEVVVKNYHVGTPKHRYYGMSEQTTRFGEKIFPGDKYPFSMVRFDWRNPNFGKSGERLCDEVMSEEFANLYIDVEAARKTALSAFNVLHGFLEKRGLILQDICFFIDQSGRCIFSEITPDCMRVTSTEGSLDKDIWRAGGSSHLLIEKWTRFLELIS